MKNKRQSLARARVRTGHLFVLILLVFSLPAPDLRWRVAAWALLVVGLVIRLWASGFIHKDDEVTQCGPYAVARNPLYFGSMLTGVAYCFFSGFELSFILLAVVFIPVYWATVSLEQEKLSQKFGAAYAAYRKRVMAFIPSIAALFTKTAYVGFDIRQLRGNKELGGAAVQLILAIIFTLRWELPWSLLNVGK